MPVLTRVVHSYAGRYSTIHEYLVVVDMDTEPTKNGFFLGVRTSVQTKVPTPAPREHY